MADSRELDVIIFGATGFTGKHAIYQGIKILAGYKWGVAGRSQAKLEKILKEIGDKAEKDLSATPIIIADVDKPDTLKAMAEKCKVVINCTGPYRLWGEPVVRACIEAGTHQVDVTGEPQYMERMVIEYNDRAKEKGSYIVSACGFDSIPADMGVMYLKRHFEGTVNSVEQFIETSASGTDGAMLNTGTWQSLVYGIAHWDELKEQRKKLFKEPLPSFKPKLKSRAIVHKSTELDKWCVPFLGSDASVVYRSQRYLYETENERPIQIKAYLAVGSIWSTILLILFGVMLGIMAKFSFTRQLLLRYPRIFSFGMFSPDGVSEENMEKTTFTTHLYGKGWTEKLYNPTEETASAPNKKIHIKVSGTNPGYGFTCVALVSSAVALLKDKSKLPARGGIYTPAAAFAKTDLIEDMIKYGAVFEVVSAKEETKKDE